MRRRLHRFAERARGSLFYLPAGFVVLSLVLAGVVRVIEKGFQDGGYVLLSPSADSARIILTTIAGATITVAGIVFSVTLVSLQLAASQFSPRVLQGFLRDRFSQAVIGLVVGTFTYSLVVLTGIGPSDEDTATQLSVTIAVILAVAAVLAIIAFIDRSARSMQVGQVIQRIAEDTRARIAHLLPYVAGQAPQNPLGEIPLPEGESYTVRSTRDGWIQSIDEKAFAAAASEGSVLRIDVRVGTFVVDRTPLCTIWPVPDDCDEVAAQTRRAFIVGRERTMWEDVTFGVLQLVDIALRALSTGVNDPTTADDAMGGIGGVLADLLHRDLPPRVRYVDGRRVYRPHDLVATAYIDLAFEQIRVAGASQPAVCVALLNTLARLQEKLIANDLSARTAPLRRQAELVVASAQETCPVPEDRERVRKAAEDHGLVATS